MKMSTHTSPASSATDLATRTNGSGAAALLAAAIGSVAVALFGIAADKSAAIKSFFVFYKPAGQLTGETTAATVVWLAAWGILEFLWRRKNVKLKPVGLLALALIVLSMLLTFPPIGDLF
jgi:hypothetical protein